VAGGTWFHTEGGNDRPQDGPGALIDAAQPAHQLAAGQPQLVRGIDLPDGMHGRGPRRRVRARAPAGGGAAQAGLAQPAAQAAGRGQLGLGEVPAEDQADQLGPPVGVLLAQRLGLQQQGRGGARSARRPVIGRRWRLAAVGAPQAEQVVDGAQREAEAPGQSGGGQPALLAAEDGLTDGRGDGAWHDSDLHRNPNETEKTQRA
jgi:hypothetical protein